MYSDVIHFHLFYRNVLIFLSNFFRTNSEKIVTFGNISNIGSSEFPSSDHTIPSSDNITLTSTTSSTDLNTTLKSDIFTKEMQDIVEFDGTYESEETYIYIYTVFIIACVILTTSRSILYYKICTTASKILHNKMFANVLQAPMRFFDTNPSGR